MRTNAITVEDGAIATGVAACAAGERLMGGAASWQTPAADLLLSSSAPVPTGVSGQLPTQWSASFVNVAGSTGAAQARTWAICGQSS